MQIGIIRGGFLNGFACVSDRTVVKRLIDTLLIDAIVTTSTQTRIVRVRIHSDYNMRRRDRTRRPQKLSLGQSVTLNARGEKYVKNYAFNLLHNNNPVVQYKKKLLKFFYRIIVRMLKSLFGQVMFSDKIRIFLSAIVNVFLTYSFYSRAINTNIFLFHYRLV